MTVHVDFEVRSAIGELLYTTPHEDLARRAARRLIANNPGLRVEVVERVEYRRTIWTDRASQRACAA